MGEFPIAIGRNHMFRVLDWRTQKMSPLIQKITRRDGWVAETTCLLNMRAGNRTGGSNPPLSAYDFSVNNLGDENLGSKPKVHER